MYVSLLQSGRIKPEAHPSSDSMCNGDLFHEEKPAGAWNWSLTSIQGYNYDSAELQLHPPIRLHGKNKDKCVILI
jgi:hypothetical protein